MAAIAEFTGLYAPPTAARILLASRMADETYRTDSRTLIRWVRQGLTTPDLADVRGWDMVLSFEDLVSLRIIAALRSAGLSWHRIREGEAWLRDATGYPRPFAREELWTSTTELFARFKGMLVALSRHGQIAMDALLEFLIPVAGLRFEGRVARAWEPRDHIVIDPKVQFGEACIKGTRIPASSVASMVRSGDPKRFVMEGYGISEDELEAALDWAERVAA